MSLAPRFVASAGTLYADRRPITLAEGFSLSRRWCAEALNCQRTRKPLLAAEYRRQAEALESAARECARWRRAAGYLNPLDADREPESAA